MSEMVLRVAMAIWAERQEIPGGIPSEEYVAMARAAIEAMREPSATMKIIIESDVLFGDGCLSEAWPLMIDAALAEP